MAKAVVVASINVDITVNVSRIPAVGETILGTAVHESRGGKGANQAVALARLGAAVSVIGAVGEGPSGDDYRRALADEGIDVTHVASTPGVATGTALITVDAEGNNNIVVVPAANATLTPRSVADAADIIEQADVVLSQFEVPLPVTIAAFTRARSTRAITVLNPAPAHSDGMSVVGLADVLVPNEVEFEQLTGSPVADDSSLRHACGPLFSAGVAWVVITLGGDGVALVGPDVVHRLPAERVSAVDTTAAGDSFVAGLSSILAQQRATGENRLSESTLLRACEFATRVAAKTVQTAGAQPSLPFAADLDD